MRKRNTKANLNLANSRAKVSSTTARLMYTKAISPTTKSTDKVIYSSQTKPYRATLGTLTLTNSKDMDKSPIQTVTNIQATSTKTKDMEKEYTSQNKLKLNTQEHGNMI